LPQHPAQTTTATPAAPPPPPLPHPVQTAAATPPNAPPLPPTASASAAASLQACAVKNITVPWGGTGSASMIVLGNKSCFIGWHDTGNTILDAMEVRSSPAHGSIKPQDQHVVIFSPNADFHGKDAFTLTLHERSALDGQTATAVVNVAVTVE